MNKRDIAIDLTSLLDVIFIILLIVMCGQKDVSAKALENAEQAQTALEESQAAREEALQEKELFEQHALKYEETENYVLFVDVSAKVVSKDDSGRPSSRKIMVMSGVSGSENEMYSENITPDNDGAAYVGLRDHLESVIQEYINGADEVRPVILTINKGDEDILYRDEVAIEKVFSDLRGKYEGVY